MNARVRRPKLTDRISLSQCTSGKFKLKTVSSKLICPLLTYWPSSLLRSYLCTPESRSVRLFFPVALSAILSVSLTLLCEKTPWISPPLLCPASPPEEWHRSYCASPLISSSQNESWPAELWSWFLPNPKPENHHALDTQRDREIKQQQHFKHIDVSEIKWLVQCSKRKAEAYQWKTKSMSAFWWHCSISFLC